jgi:hypothetical protein
MFQGLVLTPPGRIHALIVITARHVRMIAATYA